MKKHARKPAIAKGAFRTAKKAVKKATTRMVAAAAMSEAQIAHQKARVQSLANMKSYNPGKARYTQVLEFPFQHQPYPLGFGTAIPTSVNTAFSKFTLTPVNTTTSFAVRLVPTVGNFYIQTYEGTVATSTLSASVGINFAPTNASAITATARQGRVIAAGLRLTFRYAATNARGNIWAVPIYSDNITNLQNLTFGQVAGLESANWGKSGGDGEITMECTYRPLDLTSYEFGTYPLNNPSTTQNIPMLLIGGSGWVAGSYSIEVNSILHLETIGGLLASAADDRVGMGSSDEALKASTRAGDPTRSLTGMNINAGHAEKLHSAYRMVKSTMQLSQQLSNALGGSGGVLADGIGGVFSNFPLRSTAPTVDVEEKKEEEPHHENGEVSRPLSPTSYVDLNPLDLTNLPKERLLEIIKAKRG